MLIGERLRTLRELKNLSQGDIERRTGLIRCYASRVECGHTVPSIETLEKFARALEVPIYHLLYDGEKPPVAPGPKRAEKPLWGDSGRDARTLALSASSPQFR
jgi:transcriptional regulator with XRE-family HTH domain